MFDAAKVKDRCVQWIRDFFKENGKGCNAVVGISGGLDSTLALLTCVKALDRIQRPHTDIIAVTMPCFGTTKRTRSAN